LPTITSVGTSTSLSISAASSLEAKIAST